MSGSWASALATFTPTSNEPARPGPRLTATALTLGVLALCAFGGVAVVQTLLASGLCLGLLGLGLAVEASCGTYPPGVARPEEPYLAVVRLQAPFEPRSDLFLEA